MRNFTIIVPIHNEEKILEEQVRMLYSNLHSLNLKTAYEILLVENGSTDKTYKIAKRLSEEVPHVNVLKLKKASYGGAYKEGIKHAKYNVVVQFDIDFWDTRFLKKSLDMMSRYDIVIGSKNLLYSKDERPFGRRFMSKFVEITIQSVFKVNITDTHGLKTAKRQAILPYIDQVRCKNHFFDTELLIRCYHSGYRFKELPVEVREIRETRFNFFNRSFAVLKELSQLVSLRWRDTFVANTVIKRPAHSFFVRKFITAFK